MITNPEVESILEQATVLATQKKHEYVTLEHTLLSLITYESFRKQLDEFNIDTENMILDVTQYLDSSSILKVADNKKITQPKKTNSLERMLNRAVTQVLFSGRRQIDIIDIYLSLMAETNSHSYYFLVKWGVTRNEFISFYQKHHKVNKSSSLSKEQAIEILEEYTINLTNLAKEKKLEPVVGRETEIEDIINTLARKFKSNVLMVGDPGVGKTAIAEGIANKIVNNDIPEFLSDYQLYSLEVGSLLAGSKYRGDFEEKVKNVLEALSVNKKSILFIDEAHTIKGAGSSNSSSVDFANMIKPALTRGQIKIIASTTWEEYYDSFEKDRALMRRFYRIGIDEPSLENTIKIIKGLKPRLDEFHHVNIEESAINSAVELSNRYIHDRKNPDKSIDLIDAACAKLKANNLVGALVTDTEIKFQISKTCGVPEHKLNSDSHQKMISLEGNIKQKLYGQDVTVDEVLNRIYVSYAGISNEKKPMASFLFLGPTGTGKTELAKLLSQNLNMPLLRYDMSEYQEKHSVATLIGSPPGYVGFDEGTLGGGKIINDLSKNPYAILLFDEIEKAHQDIYNLFLQLLDEGHISSTNGKVVNAKNTIVIMTSNLGASDSERNNIGFGDQAKSGVIEKAVKDFFKPELRNRIDHVCYFSKLDKLSVTKIVNKFMDELKNQLLKQHNISLVLSDSVIDYIAETGYDVKMGARPVLRKIDEIIRVPISKKILFEQLSNVAINATVESDKVVFKL